MYWRSHDVNERNLSLDEARALKSGVEHFAAYVGPPKQWDFMGATQFRLLCSLGLRHNHRVLDVGCGSLRAGRFMMLYLDKGHYYGIEPNKWLIDDMVAAELGEEFIRLRAPHFAYGEDFDATGFGVSFEFVVAQSIFSHAGPDIVLPALKSLKRSLAPGGMMLVTFVRSERRPNSVVERPGWTYPGNTSYSHGRVMELVEQAGLFGRELPWYHPRQNWYALANDPQDLPPKEFDVHLTGEVISKVDLSKKPGA